MTTILYCFLFFFMQNQEYINIIFSFFFLFFSKKVLFSGSRGDNKDKEFYFMYKIT